MTTPTGKLAYGQPGNYDAADDRAVITAVTGGRLGLVRPVVVAAGTGLNIVVQGGWVGVASCDDLTSAVVGSRDELVVQGNPGPGAGQPREDVIWCDTNPDEGTWQLAVVTRAETAYRSGIPLAWVTVPVGANLAIQMNIRPVDASIDRRLLSYTTMGAPGGADYTATTWNQALDRGVTSVPCWIEPGQWYRVAYHCSCVSLVGGNRPPLGTQLEGLIGIGERNEGQGAALSQMRRTAIFGWPYYTVPAVLHHEYIFRHSIGSVGIWRVFDGRVWKHPQTPGSIRPGGYGQDQVGPSTQWLSVEDIGS